MQVNTGALAISMVLYTVAMFAIAFWARTKIADDEDYVVAGRRLPFPLATATLLATWFGAGTLLHTTDEVRSQGLQVTALEPFGPGICLIIAALFFAKPLWSARILTTLDFYRSKYGPRTELIANLYQLSFLGWIAAQLVGIAGILGVFFDIPLGYGVVSVALVAMLYTLIGGMWSVTITDALQLFLLIAGLVVLGINIFQQMGDGDAIAGVQEIIDRSSPRDLVLVPTDSLHEFFDWLSLFLAGTIGNIPGQDLMQRVFSSRTSRIASGACLLSGLLYIVLGAFPVLSGLASKSLLDPAIDTAVLPELARRYLSTPLAIIFVLTLMSTILSTIDSAILAPSSIFAQNFLRYVVKGRLPVRTLTQISIVGVTAASVLLAFGGESAFELLEGSYSLGLPPFIILTFGLYKKRTHELAGLLTLSVGIVLLSAELVLDHLITPLTGLSWTPPVPFPVLTFGVCLVVYIASDAWSGRAPATSTSR